MAGIAARTTTQRAVQDAESALRQASWGKDRDLAARARCALRIFRGVAPDAAIEALRVDLLALDSKMIVD